MNAAESSDPLVFLQKELMRIDDPKEQQRIVTEMQKFSDAGEMETKAIADCFLIMVVVLECQVSFSGELNQQNKR